MEKTISAQVRECASQFKETIDKSSQDGQASHISGALWQDLLGRFRVWSSNIAAHQKGKASLDFRLKEASHMKNLVLQLLEFIQQEFNDLNEYYEDPAAFEPQEEPFEDQQIYVAIKDLIESLFEASVEIQNTNPIDRIRARGEINVSHYQNFDHQHVKDKFPEAPEWLRQRLAAMITKVRQDKEYYERHSRKLARGWDDEEDSKSVLSSTIASDFISPSPLMEKVEAMSTGSGTRYEPELFSSPDSLTIPPPPKESKDGKPFNCPYCHRNTILKAPGETLLHLKWARHVFEDFPPYLCPLKNCSTPGRRYQRRKHWVEHFNEQHSSFLDGQSAISCNLCHEDVGNAQFIPHMANHLQQLVLWAVPKLAEEEEEDVNVAADDLDKLSDKSVLDEDQSEGAENSPTGSLTEPADENALKTDDSVEPLEQTADGATAVSAAEDHFGSGRISPFSSNTQTEKFDVYDNDYRYLTQDDLLEANPRSQTEGKVSSEDPGTQADQTSTDEALNPEREPVYDVYGPQDAVSVIELGSLEAKLEDEYKPLVENFIDSPPSDEQTRTSEHRKISEALFTNILLKLDELEVKDHEVRASRTRLIRQSQRLLSRLDNAIYPDLAPTPKSILKKPTVDFPEDPNPIREGVAPPKDAPQKDVPPGARWTKVSRALVSPEALEQAGERFEERDDSVIILRVLNMTQIEMLAEQTRLIRDARGNQNSPGGSQAVSSDEERVVHRRNHRRETLQGKQEQEGRLEGDKGLRTSAPFEFLPKPPERDTHDEMRKSRISDIDSEGPVNAEPSETHSAPMIDRTNRRKVYRDGEERTRSPTIHLSYNDRDIYPATMEENSTRNANMRSSYNDRDIYPASTEEGRNRRRVKVYQVDDSRTRVYYDEGGREARRYRVTQSAQEPGTRDTYKKASRARSAVDPRHEGKVVEIQRDYEINERSTRARSEGQPRRQRVMVHRQAEEHEETDIATPAATESTDRFTLGRHTVTPETVDSYYLRQLESLEQERLLKAREDWQLATSKEAAKDNDETRLNEGEAERRRIIAKYEEEQRREKEQEKAKEEARIAEIRLKMRAQKEEMDAGMEVIKRQQEEEYRRRKEQEEKEIRAAIEDFKQRESQERSENNAAIEEFKRKKEEEYRRREEEEEAYKRRILEEHGRKALAQRQKKLAEEEEYKERVATDLAKAGFSQDQIQAILDRPRNRAPDKSSAVTSDDQSSRLRWTRMRRTDIALETLNYYDLPWEDDAKDAEYIIIRKDLDKEQVEVLFAHTQSLRHRALLRSDSDAEKPDGTRELDSSSSSKVEHKGGKAKQRRRSRRGATPAKSGGLLDLLDGLDGI